MLDTGQYEHATCDYWLVYFRTDDRESKVAVLPWQVENWAWELNINNSTWYPSKLKMNFESILMNLLKGIFSTTAVMHLICHLWNIYARWSILFRLYFIDVNFSFVISSSTQVQVQVQYFFFSPEIQILQFLR